MKKTFFLLWALIALSFTHSVSAQTLLFDAAGNGSTFSKIDGSQNYTLDLNGNTIVDGKIVMTAGAKAVNITLNPTIAPGATGGISVVMVVSDVNTSIVGQFVSIRGADNVGQGGLKLKSGTTDGTLHASWGNSDWGSGAIATKFPTNNAKQTVSYTYKRNNEGGGTGSAFYLNGSLLGNMTGLMSSSAMGNIALGGLTKENNTFLSVGMKIHRVQIYAGQLSASEIAAAELAIAKQPLFNVIETSTPSANDGKWYFIQSQRSAGAPSGPVTPNAPIWWTIQADGYINPQTLTLDNKQKFTLVTASEGKVTFNSLDGKTASILNDRLLFTGTTPVTEGWTITPNTANNLKGFAFPGQNTGIHQGGSGWGFKVGTGYYNLGDHSTFFFYEATPDLDFRLSIQNGIVLLKTTFIGEGMGTTSAAARDIYETAVREAIQTIGSQDMDMINAAKAKLATATKAFNDAKVKLITSTEENPIYYYIANKNPGYSLDSVIYTTGATTQCKWGSNAKPTLNMLFRFEKHATNNTYRIVNAAFPKGELVSISYGTTQNKFWTIDELTGSGAPQYKIHGGGVLHAQGAGNLLAFWEGDYNSASAWTFVPFAGDIVPLYTAQYNALSIEYAALVDTLGNPIGYTLGTAVGQFNQAAFDAVKTAYAEMVTDMEQGGATIASSIASLTTAISNLKLSEVQPKPFNGTIESSSLYFLQLSKEGSAFNNYYLTNPRDPLFNDEEESASAHRPKATLTETFENTTCLWEIRPSTSNGKHLLISSMSNNQYIDEEGRVRGASSFGDSNWTTKTLLQTTDTWSNESLLVIKIDHNGNYFNHDNAGVLGRNSNIYATYKLTKASPVQVDEATKSLRPIVLNGTIKIGDTLLTDIFSTTGQKVNNKNLKTGIYIAKHEGKTYKVIVK